MNKIIIFLSIFLALLLLSACTPAAPKFLYGTYNNKPYGYKFTFNADGTSLFEDGAGSQANGTFTVQGNELIYTSTEYCDLMNAGKATYTWTYENNSLVLMPKGEDPCIPRRSWLTLAPWYLEK
jgi:hypothetical protein